MAEWVNRTIKEHIAKQITLRKNQWIEGVARKTAGNASKATGISLHDLMTGKVMKLSIDPEISPGDLGTV